MKISTVIIATAMSGCVYQDLSDTCQFSSDSHLYEYGSSELSMIIAVPDYSATETPYLVLSDAASDPVLTVNLVEPIEKVGVVNEEFGQRCSNTKIREFALAVDSKEWALYWEGAKRDRWFSTGIALPGLEPPLRSRTFGFAFIDNSTGQPIASCGCLAR